MASLLWNATQQKQTYNIPLITPSAENLGSCLNSVLKSASMVASGKLGSSLEEQVFISIVHYSLAQTRGKSQCDSPANVMIVLMLAWYSVAVIHIIRSLWLKVCNLKIYYYFGGARSKGFATLRNVPNRGGGGGRRGLGPRNDVLTTCQGVTQRGGQRIITVFFPQ